METSASVMIDRPIHEVFAYATNPAFWPEWISTVSSVKKTPDGLIDVTVTFAQVDWLSGYDTGFVWEVTEYEPPRVVTCRMITAPHSIIRQVFESVAGSTRLTISIDGQEAGLFTSGPRVRQAVAAQLEHDLCRLVELLVGDGKVGSDPTGGGVAVRDGPLASLPASIASRTPSRPGKQSP